MGVGGSGWGERGWDGRGGHAIEHTQRPSAADLRPVSQWHQKCIFNSSAKSMCG